MEEITRPLLPPKTGYVEVINEHGEHVYKATPETEERLRQEDNVRNLQSTVSTLLGQQSDGAPQEALEFSHAIQLFAASIEDPASMMSIASIYPEWKIGVSYKIKDVFRYGTNTVGDPQLYQVLQDHTSSAEWLPGAATSLYKPVGISEDGTPEWVQPLGATDAYKKGDVVMYNGKKYESLIDANVWSPDAYPAGWKLVDSGSTVPEEPDPEEPTEETVPEFVKPSGAHDAYNIGDRVMYNGKKYESLIDANVWSPDAYPAGWKLIED